MGSLDKSSPQLLTSPRLLPIPFSLRLAIATEGTSLDVIAMQEPPSTKITRNDVGVLLQAWSGGDPDAFESLIPLVYKELRRLARSFLRSERNSHTLQTTALVHEAYLHLANQRRITCQNRNHFFGVAAAMMRRILVDHARRRSYQKRGGQATPISLEDAGEASGPSQPIDVLDLDFALRKLAQVAPDRVKLVQLRYFGGFSVEQTAEILGCSRATVLRSWRVTKAWLFRELESTS